MDRILTRTPAAADPAIRLLGVTKRYGRKAAVEGVDLEVKRGEVFGFLGPNGAGKTTTLRLLLDLIRPTSGKIEVLGMDPRRDGVSVRRRCAYLASERAMYGNLSTARHLQLVAGFRGALAPGSADALARRLRLDMDVRLERLSHGNRQKAALVATFAPSPELVLLDEPTQGLDPVARAEVHKLIRTCRRHGITVFLSSHDLHEVEEVCDRVALIRDGRIVRVAAVQVLLASQPRQIEVRLQRPVAAAQLRRAVGVKHVAVDATGTRVRATVQPPLAAILAALQPYGIVDLVSQAPDLEDLFLQEYRGAPHA